MRENKEYAIQPAYAKDDREDVADYDDEEELPSPLPASSSEGRPPQRYKNEDEEYDEDEEVKPIFDDYVRQQEKRHNDFVRERQEQLAPEARPEEPEDYQEEYPVQEEEDLHYAPSPIPAPSPPRAPSAPRPPTQPGYPQTSYRKGTPPYPPASKYPVTKTTTYRSYYSYPSSPVPTPHHGRYAPSPPLPPPRPQYSPSYPRSPRPFPSPPYGPQMDRSNEISQRPMVHHIQSGFVKHFDPRAAQSSHQQSPRVPFYVKTSKTPVDMSRHFGGLDPNYHPFSGFYHQNKFNRE